MYGPERTKITPNHISADLDEGIMYTPLWGPFFCNNLYSANNWYSIINSWYKLEFGIFFSFIWSKIFFLSVSDFIWNFNFSFFCWNIFILKSSKDCSEKVIFEFTLTESRDRSLVFCGVGMIPRESPLFLWGALIWHDSSNNGGQGSDLRHHRESSWVLKKPQLVQDQGPTTWFRDRSWFGSGPSRTDFGEDKSEQVREKRKAQCFKLSQKPVNRLNWPKNIMIGLNSK